MKDIHREAQSRLTDHLELVTPPSHTPIVDVFGRLACPVLVGQLLYYSPRIVKLLETIGKHVLFLVLLQERIPFP